MFSKGSLNLTEKATEREGLNTSAALFILSRVVNVFDYCEPVPNGVPNTSKMLNDSVGQ